MLGLKIIFSILLIAIYIVMMSIMIIFEKARPKSIIIWTIIFMFTQLIGYVAYLVFRFIYYKKKNSLLVKEKEDEIYNQLVSKKLKNFNVELEDDVFKFNNMVYGSNSTMYNNYEFFNSYKKFKENLSKDIKSATKYVFLELTKVDVLDFEDLKPLLINKAKDGILVRFSYDKRIDKKLIKELKAAGVKIYRFSKHNTIDANFVNLRNMISIDGNVVYMGQFLTSKLLTGKTDILNLYIKFKGDVVQDMDLSIRQDLAFSSGKFIEYDKTKKEQESNSAIIQFVSNKLNTDLELMLIKAVCTAKKSIQLQLQSFIPSENIMSLLRYAVNSNLDVKLIVSLKSKKDLKNYATRAYAKELALYGANVYLYDGFINYNAITIDNECVFVGDFTFNKNVVGSSLQDVVLIKDVKAVNYFNKLFDAGINNSYRINNAKFMLIKEKFYKNFN